MLDYSVRSQQGAGKMYLLTLICIPALLGLLGKFVFRHKVTWKEYALMETVSAIILILSYGIAKTADLADVEIWNGVITSKQQVTVFCSHSYSCRCHPVIHGSGKNSSVSIQCDTCYEHINDYDWTLSTNADETITVARVDRQGTTPPPRWNQAYVGEAVAVSKYYFNYVRRKPSLVLRSVEEVDSTKFTIPTYPSEVFDYYHLNRFLSVGFSEPSAPVWNDLIQKMNGRLDPHKEVNVIVVATKSNQDFEYALENAWLAGKDNDVIVILGVPSPPRISWVGVISWSVNNSFRQLMSSRVLAIGNLDQRDDVLRAIEKTVDEKFTLVSMEAIKLQIGSLEPEKTATIWLYSIAFVAQIILLLIFMQTDPFGDERRGFRFRDYS